MRVARALHDSGATGAIFRFRTLKPAPYLPILTYHRVGESSPSWELDQEVIDATPEAFTQQMEFVRRHYHVIGVDELCEFVAGATLPANSIAITFDDGYRDNLQTALPILKKVGVPAIFFVCSDYIERRKVFWWDRIHYQLKRSRKAEIELDYPRPMKLALGDEIDATISSLLRVVKDQFGLDLPRFLDALGRASEVEWSAEIERALADEHILTWDDVRTLRKAGMDVQSHTRTHRVLQTLSPEDLEEELQGSKRELEEQLGNPVRAISYPVGLDIKDSPKILEAIVRAGYQVGLTNVNGVNRFGAIDPYGLRRLVVDYSFTDSYFQSVLAIPSLIPPV